VCASARRTSARDATIMMPTASRGEKNNQINIVPLFRDFHPPVSPLSRRNLSFQHAARFINVFRSIRSTTRAYTFSIRFYCVVETWLRNCF
jgi:hypothetical protein